MSPLKSLWNLQGVPLRVIAQRTWTSLLDDNLGGRAAELGFYFLFALFPSLFTATSILGLSARSASHIYYSLLEYLSIVIPHAALSTVLDTFNQTTSAASTGKLTFGLVASIWSASVGFSAIQDGLNTVYKIKESRSYVAARLSAIGVTFILSVIVTLILGALLAGHFFARLSEIRVHDMFMSQVLSWTARCAGWLSAAILLSLLFAVIYYFAPDIKKGRWRWLTPGAAIGMLGWVVASLGLRLYVHLSDTYSSTYGSLGAVIILLTWFYLTGFMLLIGAEINSEIEAAAAVVRLQAANELTVCATDLTPGLPSPIS